MRRRTASVADAEEDRARLVVIYGIDPLEALFVPGVAKRILVERPGRHLFLERPVRTVEVDPRWLRRNQRRHGIARGPDEPLANPDCLARFVDRAAREDGVGAAEIDDESV